MTNRAPDLKKRFQQLLARHRRKPTAATWFALGSFLADHRKLAPELDWLCLKRVNAYTQSQQQGLMLGLSAVALVAYAR